jgi:hypothetical protein
MVRGHVPAYRSAGIWGLVSAAALGGAAAMPAAAAGIARGPVATADTAGDVLVSNAKTNSLDVYSTSGRLKRRVPGFTATGALAAGAAGRLYDVVTTRSTVLLYASDYKTIVATLADPGQYPAGVAYDARSGTVGVTNILSTAGGSGSVSFFSNNATTPCVTVSDPAWSHVYFGAFDARGDLYVDGQDLAGNTLIGVVKGGCSAAHIETLSTSKPLGFPGGIGVTPRGDLAILDQLVAAVDTYKPPVGLKLGAPVATTPLTDGGGNLIFARSGTTLWTLSSNVGPVLEYAYPAGGSPLVTITDGSVAGFTVVPAVFP